MTHRCAFKTFIVPKLLRAQHQRPTDKSDFSRGGYPALQNISHLAVERFKIFAQRVVQIFNIMQSLPLSDFQVSPIHRAPIANKHAHNSLMCLPFLVLTIARNLFSPQGLPGSANSLFI